MFPRTVLPATAVAALATALAGAAHADPVVRLPDAGSAPPRTCRSAPPATRSWRPPLSAPPRP
uniref:Uncharacterized protein n=1 Tax=Phenylobacterium glaciei TaxID=2803784 RepID=A0A974P4I8_9CAUL|nr:hypothetical protein JKL49_07995 [Phenylobacterium glaciei]